MALAFSVNAPPDEGDLRRGTRAELRTAAPDADWTWVESDEAAAWIRRVFTARRGRLAWRPLIALLVVFAILEASLAAAGRRREDGALGGVAERRTDRQHVEVP